jgi:hypothetical protein
MNGFQHWQSLFKFSQRGTMHPNNWFAGVPVLYLAESYFLPFAPKPGFRAQPADELGNQRV